MFLLMARNSRNRCRTPYRTPRRYIDDITTHTDIDGTTGLAHYDIHVAMIQEIGRRHSTEQLPVTLQVHLLDGNGMEVGLGQGASGTILVPDAYFWEPGAPYLYSLVTQSVGPRNRIDDEYPLPVGIRTVRVSEQGFYINNKSF